MFAACGCLGCRRVSVGGRKRSPSSVRKGRWSVPPESAAKATRRPAGARTRLGQGKPTGEWNRPVARRIRPIAATRKRSGCSRSGPPPTCPGALNGHLGCFQSAFDGPASQPRQRTKRLRQSAGWRQDHHDEAPATPIVAPGHLRFVRCVRKVRYLRNVRINASNYLKNF